MIKFIENNYDLPATKKDFNGGIFHSLSSYFPHIQLQSFCLSLCLSLLLLLSPSNSLSLTYSLPLSLAFSHLLFLTNSLSLSLAMYL